MNLDYWLRKMPRPHSVLADDKTIAVPTNARGMKDLSETIKAMEPAKLTCLDKDGNVIRSVVLEEADDKPANASAEMSDLQLFAKLLAEGYEHGRKANQPIIDSAMQFVETQGARLVKAEHEIERLRAHIHKLNLQITELTSAPPPAGDDSIVGALVAGALQSQMPGAVAPAGVTPLKNGAKK